MLRGNQLVGFGGRRSAALVGRSSVFINYHEWDSGTPGTQTLSSVSLGTPQADRYILCSFGKYEASAPGFTIGGVSATQLIWDTSSSPAGCGFFIAAVPTGATGDIVITNGIPGTYLSAVCGVWAIYGLASATAVDTDAVADTAGDGTVSLTGVETDDFLFGATMNYMGSAGDNTWTGGSETMTERFDRNFDGTYNFTHSAADGIATSTATKSIVTNTSVSSTRRTIVGLALR